MEQWQCTDFAHMLLNDDVLVSKYEKEYKEKDLFVRGVLKDWLSRNDDDATDLAVPRTWSALAECITDAGLPGALTKAIIDACPPPPQGTVHTVSVSALSCVISNRPFPLSQWNVCVELIKRDVTSRVFLLLH